MHYAVETDIKKMFYCLYSNKKRGLNSARKWFKMLIPEGGIVPTGKLA